MAELTGIIKKTLQQLNVSKEGVFKDDKYIVPLADSNEFSRVYSALDKLDGADLDFENMFMSDSSGVLVYLTDDLDITLKADFDNDKYMLILEGASE